MLRTKKENLPETAFNLHEGSEIPVTPEGTPLSTEAVK